MFPALLLYLLVRCINAATVHDVFVLYHDELSPANNFLEVASVYSTPSGRNLSLKVFGPSADAVINFVKTLKLYLYDIAHYLELSAERSFDEEVYSHVTILQHFREVDATAAIWKQGEIVFEFSKCTLLQKLTNQWSYDCGNAVYITVCRETPERFCANLYPIDAPTTSKTMTSSTTPTRTTITEPLSTTTDRSTPPPGTTKSAVPPTVDISYPHAEQGLKNLTETPMTSDNVYQILQSSLSFSELGSALQPDDLTALSLIMYEAGKLKNLEHNYSY
uniref:Secreted protein n=1 Tax=Steinernema glaseri TaxID=37863 RepID=A0A1I8AUJ3_9BILA